ncbi:hypothetical protein [Bacteroides acidifaciens]|nr:hypothetical protein [Bacteroides acidifaciens]
MILSFFTGQQYTKTNTPDKLPPLLHCHYSNINATTRQSAPTIGIGTQTLRVCRSWSLP